MVILLLRAPQLLLMRRWKIRRLEQVVMVSLQQVVMVSQQQVVAASLALARVRALVAVHGLLHRTWSSLVGLLSSPAR